MKKLVIFLIALLSFIPSVSAVEFNLQSKNALLFNMNDDSVLYDLNSDERISIASLTKITTAIVAIENIKDINASITLTYEDFAGLAEANAAQAGFYVGQTVTYKDLLYALLLPSGADAAQALARNIAGSNDQFVDLMNKKAKELNMNNTHYVNTTGLDADGHYSSLKDVSIIFKYALKNDIFRSIIETKEYTTSDYSLTFHSTVSRGYNIGMNYLIGGKTGTTDDAGVCLASIAKYDNVNYMLITARAPYYRGTIANFEDSKKIYDYFMSNYSYKEVISPDDLLVTIDTLYSKEDSVPFYANKELKLYLSNEFSKDNLKYIYIGKNQIDPSMKKGTKLGTVSIYNGDELIDSIDIVLSSKQEFDLGKYLKYYEKEINEILKICYSIIVIVVIICVASKLSMKKKLKG